MDSYYKKKRYYAITAKADNGLAREVISPVSVKVPGSFKTLDQTPYKTKALWDTGATNTVITENLCSRLKLPPISRTKVQGIYKEETKNVYLLDIIIAEKVFIQNVRITTANKISSASDEIEVLLGMDIINLGDFAITATMGNQNIPCTVFSYRFPHGPECIDYAQEIDRFNEQERLRTLNKKTRSQQRKNPPRKKRK
jgi:hypothetical protein